MTEQKRLDATVHGRVQGVGFRWFVRRNAARLGLFGWVANEPSGSVRVIAEGASAAVDQLIRDLHGGPPGAEVDHVETDFQSPTGEFAGFEIRARGHSGD